MIIDDFGKFPILPPTTTSIHTEATVVSSSQIHTLHCSDHHSDPLQRRRSIFLMDISQAHTTGDDPSRDGDDAEPIELVLFQVSECYVYIIPPRKTAASYRADEWDVNKWAWEGALKVVSKGEDCIIKLEDKSTGELYARAFLRKGEPHPVEPVIDSSRYFVLRVEENIGGRLRHAFIGIGFRERPEAYDFQAALHDHMKYLDKKKTAEEMEQQFQKTSAVDYSLKDGETLVLHLKNKAGSIIKPKTPEQGASDLSPTPRDKTSSPKEALLAIKPPPPPPAATVSAANSPKESSDPSSGLGVPREDKVGEKFTAEASKHQIDPTENSNSEDVPDDDFGDFQAAG
ncbi:Adaptin ear-binding coat-associated protein 1-like protein [Drosera capensis]